jgi:hypothetical protein
LNETQVRKLQFQENDEGCLLENDSLKRCIITKVLEGASYRIRMEDATESIIIALSRILLDDLAMKRNMLIRNASKFKQIFQNETYYLDKGKFYH